MRTHSPTPSNGSAQGDVPVASSADVRTVRAGRKALTGSAVPAGLVTVVGIDLLVGSRRTPGRFVVFGFCAAAWLCLLAISAGALLHGPVGPLAGVGALFGLLAGLGLAASLPVPATPGRYELRVPDAYAEAARELLLREGPDGLSLLAGSIPRRIAVPATDPRASAEDLLGLARRG